MTNTPHVNAIGWAATIDDLWRSSGGPALLFVSCACGQVAGVVLCREYMQGGEDHPSILISVNGAWTVVLDATSDSGRAFSVAPALTRSVRGLEPDSRHGQLARRRAADGVSTAERLRLTAPAGQWKLIR